MNQKISITFDDYERKLIKRGRAALASVARAKGEPVPTTEKVIRGAVRLGLHHMFGQDALTNDLLEDSEIEGL